MKYLSPLTRRSGLVPFSADPFQDFEKEFEKLFGGWPSLFEHDGSFFTADNRRSAVANWYENDEAYVARFELPGLKSKDIDLELKDGTLSLKAERKTRNKKEKSEATVSYSQSISLPDGVNEADASASYEDGILSVTIPKAEKAKPRRIAIK